MAFGSRHLIGTFALAKSVSITRTHTVNAVAQLTTCKNGIHNKMNIEEDFLFILVLFQRHLFFGASFSGCSHK